jgi:transposase InsO family protein
VKFAFIKEHLCAFEIGLVCQVLEVSRSGYYAWLKRPQSARRVRREQLAVKIAQVHRQSRRNYGSPRVFEALQIQGEKVCENTVADIMKEREIRAKKKRKFLPATTDSRHANPLAPQRAEPAV